MASYINFGGTLIPVIEDYYGAVTYTYTLGVINGLVVNGVPMYHFLSYFQVKNAANPTNEDYLHYYNRGGSAFDGATVGHEYHAVLSSSLAWTVRIMSIGDNGSNIGYQQYLTGTAPIDAGTLRYGKDTNGREWNSSVFAVVIHDTILPNRVYYLVLSVVYLNDNGTIYYSYNNFNTTLPYSLIKINEDNIGDIIIERDDRYGFPSEPDGYGQGVGKPTFDDSSDTIAIPDMPEIGISSAGFVNVYHVSRGALNNLGSIIFPATNLPAAAPTDVTEALTALLQYCQFFVDSLQNGKLIDYVVDCHIIPVAPADGAAATIHVGYKDTGISAPRVSSDYVDFDCGSISIGEYYANYIDYLTRARLFLPFVGFVDLKPEFWQSGVINVRYRFNVIDGSFMAYVKSTSSKSNLSDTVIGQYGGNSCVHIPLTGLNYSSFISGLVTGSMSLAASAASGNAAGAASSALSMLNNKPSVAQSNNYNASTSFLGVRCPYLMIERPVASFAQEYARDKGLPLNVTVALNSVSGYTVIDNIDFIGFDAATMDEVEEIRTLLQSGVIF